MSGNPVRIGVVGVGMIGQICHLANFARVPGCRVTAIADLRDELAARVASRWGIDEIYPDHHSLLARADVDAVVVVTKRPATGAVVRDCLQAGRHVLSEKPMAHTVEQGRLLADLATEMGRVYSVGYMKRHDPGFERFLALVAEHRASGALGALLTVRAHDYAGEFRHGHDEFDMTAEDRPDGLEVWPTAPGWLAERHHAAYAEFLNVESHDLNCLRAVFGATPEPVQAVLRGEAGAVIMECGGVPCLLDYGKVRAAGWSQGVECRFEGGTIGVAFRSPLLRNLAAEVWVETPAGRTTHAVAPEWAFRRQAAAFVADVAAGVPSPMCSGADGVEDLALSEAIWRYAI